MALKIVAVIALIAVVSINGSAINKVPGFENFTPCKSEECWNAANKAIQVLYKKGYEPYGIKKIDPLVIDDKEVVFDKVKYYVKNVEITGFDTFRDIKIKVDKEKKIIYQEATFDLHSKADMDAVFNLDKVYKLSTPTEVTYSGLVLSVKRHYDTEKREFEGKEETFIVPKGYEMTYKEGKPPTYKMSDEFTKKIKEYEPVNQWYKDNAKEFEKKRLEGLDNMVKKFTEALYGVYDKFDQHYPISLFFPQFFD